MGGETPTTPADETVADPTEPKGTPWPVIGIGIGAVVLIAAGVVVFLILRKKKQA